MCCVDLNSVAADVCVVSGTIDGNFGGNECMHAYGLVHCHWLGYVTIWKIKEEERDFEYQGIFLYQQNFIIECINTLLLVKHTVDQ